jgi:dolichol kinase
MVLLDKKIFSGGIAMLVVGGIILIYLNSMVPAGQAGMTEEEILDLMVKEQENKDMNTLAGILFGVGFLLVLISFGARRRSKGSPKKEEKKPVS